MCRWPGASLTLLRTTAVVLFEKAIDQHFCTLNPVGRGLHAVNGLSRKPDVAFDAAIAANTLCVHAE